jgi:hypothetical protein
MSQPPQKAVPIKDGEETSGTSVTPHVVVATAVPVEAYVAQGEHHEPTLDQNQAVCRGCGRTFTRPPGIHNGDARYYRCADCNQLRISNFCAVM